MRRTKITSDGSPGGTRVIDVETGKALPATEIDWHFDMEGVATATVKLVMTEIDVETNAEVITICPGCQGKSGLAPTKFDIDQTVRVRLNPMGHEVYRQHYAGIGRRLGIPVACRVDAEGFSSFQFWRLMEIFGPYTGMGRDMPFDSDIEIVAEDGR